VGIFTGTAVSKLNLIASGQGGVLFQAEKNKTYQIAVADSGGLTGAIQFTLRAGFNR
jgi:hypothetical protein